MIGHVPGCRSATVVGAGCEVCGVRCGRSFGAWRCAQICQIIYLLTS